MTDDRPFKTDCLAAAMSAMQAVGYALALRGGPDDLEAARLLHEHAAALKAVWWRTPIEIRQL